MAELIDIYKSYRELETSAYFVLQFNQIPSVLTSGLPLKASKKSMAKVLQLLDLEPLKLDTVYKVWHTEDDKETSLQNDYVGKYLFKSTAYKLLISVILGDTQCYLEFLYDGNDEMLEEEIHTRNHTLRTSLGEMKNISFNVLSKNSYGFYTEEIHTGKYEIDVNTLYNDDFQAIDKIIKTALNTQKAGLILLHGTPGTGKTSYIKSLISGFNEKSFIFIQNDFVNELLYPDFISFLLQHRDSILIIEDAEKVIMTRENNQANSVVSTILQLTDGLFSDYLNIKIICTFNTNIDKVDKALLRKGRMIAYYDFKPLEIDKTNQLLASLGHEEKVHEPMTLADIFNRESISFEEKPSSKKIGFQ